MGRKASIKPEQEVEILALSEKGFTAKEIADRFNVSAPTISKALANQGVTLKRGQKEKPRIHYLAFDPSVTLTDDSMKLIEDVCNAKGLDSFAKMGKALNITPDVAKHFMRGHHIKLSTLKQINALLGINAVIEVSETEHE